MATQFISDFYENLFSFLFVPKFFSLEMLDKVEPPTIPDGFGISVAYACLLDIVRSISIAVLGPSKVIRFLILLSIS